MYCDILYVICYLEDGIWLDTSVIANTMKFCKEDYPVVDYGFTTIPTYPSGQIGFILCSLNKVR